MTYKGLKYITMFSVLPHFAVRRPAIAFRNIPSARPIFSSASSMWSKYFSQCFQALIPSHYMGRPFRLILNVAKLIALMHVFSEYIFHIQTAAGPSMLPTLPQMCKIAILPTHRLGRGIQVGDIVCYKKPIDSERVVKRVIGLEGDYVLWDSSDDAASSSNGQMIQVRYSCRPITHL